MSSGHNVPHPPSAGRSRRVLAATLGLVCAAVACDGRSRGAADSAAAESTPADARAPAPLKVALAQIPISYSTVTHIADFRGFFRDEGLAVSVVSAPAGPDVVTLLRSTTEDAPLAGTIAVTPVATMVGAGNAPVIIATTVSSRGAARLVTFDRVGVTSAPQSLRGKRIGVVKNTNGDIYLSRLLAKGGLQETDVTLSSGRPADLVTLLVQGDIDAAVLWDPFVAQVNRRYRSAVDSSRVENRGSPVALVDSTLHLLEFNVVTTREQVVSRRTELLKFLQATLRAEAYIREHPSQAQAETERWLGLQPGDLADFFRSSDFRTHLDTLGLRSRIAEELNWLRKRSPTTAVPSDLSQYVDGSLLLLLDSTRVKP